MEAELKELIKRSFAKHVILFQFLSHITLSSFTKKKKKKLKSSTAGCKIKLLIIQKF